MSSFFYTSKTADKKPFAIPSSLSKEYVLSVLHNHSLLSQILWPHSTTTVRPEKSDNDNVSNYVLGYDGLSFKTSLTTQPDGVVCKEAVAMGFKVAIVYAVVGHEQLVEELGEENGRITAGNGKESNVDSALPDGQELFLTEENTITALRPAMAFVNLMGGATLKTKNVMHVLGSLDRNGKNVLSALADLNATGIAGETNNFGKKKTKGA